jgi:glycosyltransferase involved in cell wall biosynthesis
MKRVFYFAPVSTDALNLRFGQKLEVGAQANKVLGVCGALKAADIFPIVVSGLISSPIWSVFDGTKHFRTSGVCFSKLFVTGQGVVKRGVASIAYIVYAIRYVRSDDQVILYNYFPEYIPAALYLRIFRKAAVLDLEDAPRSDEPGLRGWGNRVIFPIVFWLCSKSYLTVSRQLGEQLGLRRCLAVYGVSSFFDNNDHSDKFKSEEVKILFGGSIVLETGLELFQAAVGLLLDSEPQIPLHFFITGNFPNDEMQKLAAKVASTSRMRISVFSNLPTKEYRKLAEEADVGLCLKLPSTSIGQTTFPSKVIEFAALGMLVLSTSVSDVPVIFDDESALLLTSEDPKELAAALSEVSRNRGKAAERARNGRQLVLDRFSKSAVGKEIVEFLNG